MKKNAPKGKPLWTCPKCGQTFVTARVWHSCVNVPIDAHFKGKPPELRKTFDKFLALARKIGPITVRSAKTRISFQANTRFAGATVRATDLLCGVALDHGDARPPVRKVEKYGGTFVHSFALKHPSDVDETVGALLKEAYVLDGMRHGGRSE